MSGGPWCVDDGCAECEPIVREVSVVEIKHPNLHTGTRWLIDADALEQDPPNIIRSEN